MGFNFIQDFRLANCSLALVVRVILNVLVDVVVVGTFRLIFSGFKGHVENFECSRIVLFILLLKVRIKKK